MKKVYALLIIVILACAFNLWYVNPQSVKTSTLYSNCAEIVDIENDVVTVKDTNGNLWAFNGADGRAIGDKVVCIMDTMKTASIFDDEIVNVTFEK